MEQKGQTTENLRLTDGEITLRPFTDDDAATHLANDDEEQAKWLGGKSTEESVKNWIQRNTESWQNNGPIFNFAITDTSGQVVGTLEANTNHEIMDGVQEGDANISYAIYPFARGKGYMSRAITLMEGFLKDKGIRRSVIRVSPENTDSVAVPIRLGYEDKGQIHSKDEDNLRVFVKELNPSIIETKYDEGRLVKMLEPESLRGRDGDWEHAKRVVGWVKKLGEGRDDLPLLVTAGYVHDLGWRDVIPPQKLTLDRLREYEPIANANSEPYITEFLNRLGYSDEDIATVIRIVKAVDAYDGHSEDEDIVCDADSLSKLCVGHVKQKFQPDEWLHMVEFWRVEVPKRIRTEAGKKLYPGLLDQLEQELRQEK